MIDFVPLHQYTHYFDVSILIMILLAVWQCHRGTVLNKDAVNINATWGVVFTIVLILYMGLRPVAPVFGDTMNYARDFYEVAESKEPFTWQWEGEWLFFNTMNWFAKYSDIHMFFLLCAIGYIGCLWLATVRIFKTYYYIPLLVIMGMFTFWQYGVNGIRNGLGASLFILAMTYVNNPKVMIMLVVLGCGCHNSVFLMAAAAAVAWFIKDSRIYLAGWVACVIASYIAGSSIQDYLANIGIFDLDDRFSGYLTGDVHTGENIITSMVFRWDFLLYSAMGVGVGYYFVVRKKFDDEYYHWIFNTFLATNAFWVLIIRAAYSNRFAQISWFILPIVLVYPFFKQRFWENHEKMLGYAILMFYAFAFYSNILK